MFRAECKAGTPLGKLACSILASGQLVPDELTNQIVGGRISQKDCAAGFLLDGYPRTVPQASHFASVVRDRKLPNPIVIHLDAPDRDLIARLTSRRQCTACKRIYNLQSQPPRVAGICNHDGAPLTRRADDAEEVIVERLRAYENLTGPVLRYYGKDLVLRVDASQPPEQVRQAIENAIGLRTPQTAIMQA